MNRIPYSFVLFLSMALPGTFFLPSPAHADKVQEIQQEIADRKAVHAALAQKVETLGSEVSSLKKGLVSASRNLRASEEKLSETDRNLKNLKQKKSLYLQNLYKDQNAMGNLVAAARKYSQTSTALMLLQSRPIDAARASMVMKSMIPVIHQRSTYLQLQLVEIGKIENAITDQLAIQTQQANKLNKEQANLAKLLEDRNRLYQSTESQRVEQEKEVAVLTQESRNLEELMEHLKEKSEHEKAKTKSAHAALPSNILLPVHGDVRTGFGDQDDLGAKSKGITFLTRSAASVIVPLAGIVKFAGPFQNYKQILIVEHQGGYHSLIAGLARIDTVVGASLAAGEPVGVAETSGSPQIYYELRQNGRPVNPQKLLVAQRKQEKS